jgi:hypothetical protein
MVPQGYCDYYGAGAFVIAAAGLGYDWARGRPKVAVPQAVAA